MGALFTAEEIMELTEGRIAVGLMHEDVGEICTDTRLLQEGQWFLALAGEQFDGHDFLGEAFSSGAIGCIVEERSSYPIASTSFPLIAVPDTEEALRKLARNWRKRLNPRIALIPADDSLEALIEILKEEFAGRFQERFLFLPNARRIAIFNQLLAMPDDTRAVLIQYHVDLFEDVEKVGYAALPSVVLLTEESVESFRLQISDKELGAIPFAIMPTLKLNYGLVIIDAVFGQRMLANVSDAFLRNVLLFGIDPAEEASAAFPSTKFLRAAGPIDDKVSGLLVKAEAYAESSAKTDDYLKIMELAAIIMLMMGVELSAT